LTVETSISKHKDGRWLASVGGRPLGEFNSRENAKAAVDLVVTGKRKEGD